MKVTRVITAGEVSLIKHSTLQNRKSSRGPGDRGTEISTALYIFLLVALIISVTSLARPLMVHAQEARLSIVDGNGRTIMADPPPVIIEGRTLVPVASLADALQARVVWDGEQQIVTVTRGNDTIRMRTDSAQARMNGQDLYLEVAVCNIEDRVYVPLVPVAEALGAKLEWNEETRTLKLLPGAGSASVSKTQNTPRQEGTPSATLTIKAGYFGTPYNTMKVFTLSELEAMAQVQQAYSFIDSMPAVVIDSVQGVKLTDILLSAGIDINSIDVLYFYTTDVEKGWYQSLPKAFLLDARRYYYPNLPSHWDSDEQKALPGAADGAIPVEPVIATRDYWKRFATSPDFAQMTADSAFRLAFGQVNTSDCTAMRSAKWIREISVMLVGNPPSEVSLNQHTARALVGSTFQLTAAVGPSDAANKKVTWSSSNPEAATVDSNGLVSVVGPGAAAITVTTVEGKHTDTCIVNDSKQGDSNQEDTPVGAGRVNDEPNNPGSASSTESQQRYLAEKALAGRDTASRRSGRVFEISAEIVPLQPQAEHGNLNSATVVTSLAFFLLGAGRRYTEYTKEVPK
ncbi:MAG: stalk domain-containing protein [Syntrophomonas sp.]